METEGKDICGGDRWPTLPSCPVVSFVATVVRTKKLRMKLSETGRGSKWLQNFSVDDQPTANRLIYSLVLVGWDHARLQLLQLASEVIAESRQEGPIWVLSVLDGDDIRKRRKLGPDDALIAFEDYSPGEDIGPLPRSEARVGNLIRDLRGKKLHTQTFNPC